MLCNLVFSKNTILSCFLFFFLIINLYFSIFLVNGKIFIPNAELINPITIPTKEAKEKIETYPVIAEAKISNCLI